MYQYSFANVDLIIDTGDYPNLGSNPSDFKVTGFGTGEGLINIARKAPIASTLFGAYGDMVVNMQRIRAGDLSFNVLMNAPENQYLQDWANYFQQQADADGQLIKPIQAKLVDNMGRDSVSLNNGVILAMPAMSRGQMMNTVTWILTFEEVVFDRSIGGDVAAL
jgi:hypothetical protein|tara:strand:+ start:1704 stop:2195 length:492 start_codon:yes stop_codon:yes gene_type:complete